MCLSSFQRRWRRWRRQSQQHQQQLQQHAARRAAEERDGYAVLDLYAGWTPMADQPLRINLGVDNVFDEDYERVFAGVSEAGRSVRIDLTWTGAW